MHVAIAVYTHTHTHTHTAGHAPPAMYPYCSILTLFQYQIVCLFFCIQSIHAVHVPAVIINQMQFSQFTMLKMFLSAVATSMSFTKTYIYNDN